MPGTASLIARVAVLLRLSGFHASAQSFVFFAGSV